MTAVILWGTSFVAMKSALSGFEPLAIVAVRMILASAVMLPFWSRLPPPTRQPGDRRKLAFLAALYPCAYFACESNAINLTTASQAGAVSAVAPLLVAVGARLFLSEALSRWAAIGLAVSIGGVIALSLGGPAGASAPNPALGNLLEIVAMATYAASTIVLKQLTGRYSPWFLTGLQCAAGAILFLPALIPAPVQSWADAPMIAWAGVAYLGLAVTLLPIGLYNFAVSRMAVARAAIAVNLVPVVAILTGWAMLGDSMTPIQLAACAAIVAGVLLGQRRAPGRVPDRAPDLAAERAQQPGRAGQAMNASIDG